MYMTKIAIYFLLAVCSIAFPPLLLAALLVLLVQLLAMRSRNPKARHALERAAAAEGLTIEEHVAWERIMGRMQ